METPPNITHTLQDRNSEAWQRLCEYVDRVAEEGAEEFSPSKALGHKLFMQIYTLPESIANLKKVKKVWLYGSALKWLPQEIGQMESLEYFDPYTSYSLHWFPYELLHCTKLADSYVSTRALYGNYKNRMPFPDLTRNPIRFLADTVTCSICHKRMTYAESNQQWITLRVGTDNLPLLANICSAQCQGGLGQPPKGYLPYAHKGGKGLEQPKTDRSDFYEKVEWTPEVPDTE